MQFPKLFRKLKFLASSQPVFEIFEFCFVAYFEFCSLLHCSLLSPSTGSLRVDCSKSFLPRLEPVFPRTRTFLVRFELDFLLELSGFEYRCHLNFDEIEKMLTILKITQKRSSNNRIFNLPDSTFFFCEGKTINHFQIK